MQSLNIGFAPGNKARGSGQEIHALKMGKSNMAVAEGQNTGDFRIAAT